MGTGANGVGSSDGSGEISHFARRYLRCGGGSGGNGLLFIPFFSALCGGGCTNSSGKSVGVRGDVVGDDVGVTSIDATKLSRRAILSAC